MNINEKIITMNDETAINKSTNNIWKKEEEELLREWSDKAQCFRWLHTKSHQKYRWINAYFTIPVIILSTLTGAANFSQERVPESQRGNMVLIIGSLNIIAGIVSTIAQYLKVAEINEGHRISGLSWGKFHRKLKVELSRHPNNRSSPDELIKSTREEYDRLVEISPPIPEDIINRFMKDIIKKKLSEQKEGSKNARKAERKNKLDLNIPEVCGEINPTNVYNNGLKQNDDDFDDYNSVNLQKQMLEIQRINEFKSHFKKIHGRDPTDLEINQGIDNQMNMPINQNIINIDSGAGVFENNNFVIPTINQPQ